MRAVHQQALAKKHGAGADCKKANTTPSIKSTFGGEQYFNRHLHEEWHSVRIVKNVQMDQVKTCWRRASRGNIYARAANQRRRGVMLYYVPVLTYRAAEVSSRIYRTEIKRRNESAKRQRRKRSCCNSQIRNSDPHTILIANISALMAPRTPATRSFRSLATTMGHCQSSNSLARLSLHECAEEWHHKKFYRNDVTRRFDLRAFSVCC